MDAKQALALVDNTVASVQLNRRDHINLNAATAALSQVIGEHVQLVASNGELAARIKELEAKLAKLEKPPERIAALVPKGDVGG